jgi:hypothetical protein
MIDLLGSHSSSAKAASDALENDIYAKPLFSPVNLSTITFILIIEPYF